MIFAVLKRSLLPLIYLAILGVAPVANAYYDPGIQRWINRDPKSEEGGINLFNFVNNDSVGQIDPYGLTPLSDCLAQADKNLASCVNSVRKWCGKNIYQKIGLITDNMNCGQLPGGILAKLGCLVLKKALQLVQGAGTVIGAAGGSAACGISYKGEIDACKAVYGPPGLPTGPKW